MTTPIRVHLIVRDETATVDVDDDDRKRYLARADHHALPLTIALERTEPLTARSPLPRNEALETLSRLGLDSHEAALDCAAEIEFLLRDDSTSIEFIAPGSGDKVTGTREQIERRVHDDFGIDLNLAVLTLDNPKLCRTFPIAAAPEHT